MKPHESERLHNPPGYRAKDEGVVDAEIREFARKNRGDLDGRCFVATVAFGNPASPEVIFLRQFRDQRLMKSWHGRLFIRAYYHIGPYLAGLVARSELLIRLSRGVLRLVIKVLLK